jgi:hypothetical protein
MILPWLLGVLWLRARWIKASDINWPTLLGYGYLAGALATTLAMRVLDMFGIRLGFASISLALMLLIAIGAWASHGTAFRWRDIGADWRGLTGWPKAAYIALLAIIVIRLGGLGMEVVWRPLYPWDAWYQWATSSRVWYELGHLAPFVTGDDWLAGKVQGAYTNPLPQYPPAIPLLQVWMSFSLGRWDDSLMNLPWLQCAIALGLAFYGQARRLQMPPLFAMMFTYFLLSLPMLDTHVALAGYADLFMGAFYSLTAMAFFQWARTRDRWQGTAALLLGLGCAFIKQPGILWVLTFLPALWVVLAPRSGLIASCMLAGASVFTLLFLGESGNINLLGYNVHVRYVPVWETVRQNLLIMDNWHLLWYLVIAALVLSLPRLLTPALRAMTVLAFTVFSFLGVIFFFTQATELAENLTVFNRAFLHIAPMILFYAMLLFHEAVRMPSLNAFTAE